MTWILVLIFWNKALEAPDSSMWTHYNNYSFLVFNNYNFPNCSFTEEIVLNTLLILILIFLVFLPTSHYHPPVLISDIFSYHYFSSISKMMYPQPLTNTQPPDHCFLWGFKFLRFGCFFSHWCQTRLSSAVNVLGASEQPGTLWCLVDDPVSEISQGSRLIETAFLLMLLTSSLPFYSLSLIQPQGFISSLYSLDISAYVSFSCLLVFSEDSHARYIIVLVIMSNLGVSPWDGSWCGRVTGTHFPQSLLQFCLCSSFRGRQFWLWVFDGAIATPALHWWPDFLLEMDSISSFSSLLGISSKNSLFDSWDFPTLSLHSRGSPPSPISQGCIFPFLTPGIPLQ